MATHSLPYVCSYGQKGGDKGDLLPNYLYDHLHIPIQVSKYLAQLEYLLTKTSTSQLLLLLGPIPYYTPSELPQLSSSFHVLPNYVKVRMQNTCVANGGIKFVEIYTNRFACIF